MNVRPEVSKGERGASFIYYGEQEIVCVFSQSPQRELVVVSESAMMPELMLPKLKFVPFFDPKNRTSSLSFNSVASREAGERPSSVLGSKSKQ